MLKDQNCYFVGAVVGMGECLSSFLCFVAFISHANILILMSTVQKSEVSGGVLCIVDQTQQWQMLASMSTASDSSRIRMDCKIIWDMQADTGHCA